MIRQIALVIVSACTIGFAGSASATTITIGSPNCVPPTKTYTVPVSGSVGPVTWDVTQCPKGVLYYSASGGASLGLSGGGATHIYKLILEDDASTGPITITSGEYDAPGGFSIATFLDGFASYQGNPGGSFSWSIEITGTFSGGSSTSVHSGVITGSPQKRFRVYDRRTFGPGEGMFVSTLTVTTSGDGELHLEKTGKASLAPIPLPASAVLLLGSLGLLGVFRRRGCDPQAFTAAR